MQSRLTGKQNSMNRFFVITAIIAFLHLGAFARTGENPHFFSVVIDTDGGADDFRALSVLLARPEISVKGVCVSDGNVSPREGYRKVKEILTESGMEHIPLGLGRTIPGLDPEWRKFNESLSWGNHSGMSRPGVSSYELLTEILSNNPTGITLICLGPLNNVAELLIGKPSLASRIERIIWYNEENPESKSGFNYAAENTSAEKVMNSGIRVDIISNLNLSNASFDLSFLSDSLHIQSKTATLISDFYKANDIPADRYNSHLRLMDELVAIYILRPELFEMKTIPGKRHLRFVQSYELPAVQEVIKDLLTGVYSQETQVVFAGFPVSPQFYNYDVRRMMEEAISRHGMEEWKAAVIASEFHRHLGTYSLIGVKMGIYALEILQTKPDLIRVHSYAGNNPPYSCLNDGLQVSTGATLGMGTISVSDNAVPEVAADFSFEGKTIRLSLKPEYLEQVDADISEGIVKYGLSDEGYWKLIRQSAIKYWLEWERTEIFNVHKY
jgi:inosine-uridine nucleoside N-ribohydrolase/formylmethanofuran dehydrogenase subunit E